MEVSIAIKRESDGRKRGGWEFGGHTLMTDKGISHRGRQQIVSQCDVRLMAYPSVHPVTFINHFLNFSRVVKQGFKKKAKKKNLPIKRKCCCRHGVDMN